MIRLRNPWSRRSGPSRAAASRIFSGRRCDEFGIDKVAINTGALWLIVSRISATSSADRAVVDPVSCRLGAI
jgi:hypothetical protein